MNMKLSIIAVLTLSTHMAMADTPIETSVVEPAENTGSAEATEAKATEDQIKTLENNLTGSLQKKLEDQMNFGAIPLTVTRREVASAY